MPSPNHDSQVISTMMVTYAMGPDQPSDYLLYQARISDEE